MNPASKKSVLVLAAIWITPGFCSAQRGKLRHAGISPDAALALREARTQAFSDAFYLIMIGFLPAAQLVPLMKKPPAH